MQLFEKIFQRDDKFFLLSYYLFLSIVLYFSSVVAYYVRNDIWNLPSLYTQGSILISLTFIGLAIFRSKENRFIKGTTQWFRVEFVILIQTFVLVVLLTVIFKNTNNYSRIWFFTDFSFAIIFFIISKVFFDLIYSGLILSNTIQRNILLIGDTASCQDIISKFPKKRSNSIIKCLIAIDQLEKKDLNFYGVPTFSLKDDYNYIFNHHAIGQIWIVSSTKTQAYIEKLIDKFLHFSVDCRLILPESKFKFIEGLDSEAGFDFYNVSFSPFYGTNFLIKNFLDKLFALFFLVLSLPLIILFSLFIIIEDGFPIFFKQKRTGWDGNSFDIFKLRSLTTSNKKNIL